MLHANSPVRRLSEKPSEAEKVTTQTGSTATEVLTGKIGYARRATVHNASHASRPFRHTQPNSFTVVAWHFHILKSQSVKEPLLVLYDEKALTFVMRLVAHRAYCLFLSKVRRQLIRFVMSPFQPHMVFLIAYILGSWHAKFEGEGYNHA